MKYDFTIEVRRPLRTVSNLMQAYLTARSGEGGGGLCVKRLVRGTCGIGSVLRSVFELPILLND